MEPGVKKGCMLGCMLSVAIMFGTVVFVAMAIALAVRTCASKVAWLGDEAAKQVDTSMSRPLDEAPFRKVCLSATSDEAKTQVLRVDIHGVISDEVVPSLLLADSRDTSAPAALRKIRAATKDKDIRGLYLDVDSPGGGVTVSDELYDAIRRFRESDTNRFVFVHMGDLCCSGGYYLSAAASWIMARPTTTTGSIGVIMSSVNAAELARKIGLQPVTIASGANKAMLNPLEPVNPEHVKILERPVKQLHERFVEIVAKGRAMPVEKVREIADGRVLSAADALECGLVDGIGQVADARDQLVKLAGGEVRICAYRDKSDFWSLFGDTLMLESAARILRKVEAAMDGDSAPRAEYRLR